jgi:hypothetical protein
MTLHGTTPQIIAQRIRRNSAQCNAVVSFAAFQSPPLLDRVQSLIDEHAQQHQQQHA